MTEETNHVFKSTPEEPLGMGKDNFKNMNLSWKMAFKSGWKKVEYGDNNLG